MVKLDKKKTLVMGVFLRQLPVHHIRTYHGLGYNKHRIYNVSVTVEMSYTHLAEQNSMHSIYKISHEKLHKCISKIRPYIVRSNF